MGEKIGVLRSGGREHYRAGQPHRDVDAEAADAMRRGRHYWITTVGYHLPGEQLEMLHGDQAAVGTASLTLASVVQMPITGCWLCERSWTPDAASTRCPGPPKGYAPDGRPVW